MSIAKVILYTVISFFAVVYVGGAATLTALNYDKVSRGVTYMGRDISGMTKTETQNFFAQEAQNRLSKISIIMQYGNNSWTIGNEDIGLVAKTDEAVNSAYSLGKTGSGYTENLISQLKLFFNKRDVTLSGEYDKERLKAKLLEIKAAVDTEPVNATVTLHPDGMITKTDGVVGKKLDIEPLMAELDEKLTSLSKTGIIILEPAETQPYVKTSDIAAIDSVLGAYTTSFPPLPDNRGHNIILASSKLNDIIIKSGATFSFNTAVGHRTQIEGYKTAPVLIAGRTESDYGGGVCQVSTTLYNAVLLAGLTPTVRSPHYYPMVYCPPGLDATVADGVVDFQFTNPLKHPVYILAKSDYSDLTVYILGTKSDLNGNTISIETSGTRRIPTVHRLYMQNGVVVNREFMHTDYYD